MMWLCCSMLARMYVLSQDLHDGECDQNGGMQEERSTFA